ncbi:MAG: aminotransferase class I/II-fold pyridoxal phosphate-dependent enzyme [Anaerolineae bacterium]|nr:aminotransferase class I/II-fold pyridoxal phosphate-dependent enzyme [Anaerolineae bacterium]
MRIAPFALERYFAKYEFSARYPLSSSDCEALSLSELLAMADAETTRLWEKLKLGYTETLGHPLLRKTIAEIYAGIAAENILVMAPEEGIFLLMHALLEPGDHVICTFPAYQSLHEVARSIGCEVSTWEPDEERGWRFDIGLLEEKIQATTKLVVVNFPHNPTGYVPPQEDFEAIVDLARRWGVYLLSDEMYHFLEIDRGSTLPAACELYDRAFSLFGLSKTFGLPGLRIGWMASQDHEILKRMSLLKDYTTICNSAPSEILAIMALRNRAAIIEQQLERAHKNLAVLDSFFDAYDDCFRWNRPKGGSICFPRMLVVQNTTVFCEKLVSEIGIMLVPSSTFHFGDHHIRIGFGRENLPDVIERFAEYLERRFRQ